MAADRDFSCSGLSAGPMFLSSAMIFRLKRRRAVLGRTRKAATLGTKPGSGDNLG
jgi:hypothetical protein